MGLAILNGYSQTCRDSQGGVLQFYATEWENIDQATYAEASGVVTTINLNVGKKFHLFYQELETCNYSEVQTPNRANGTNFVDQTFNATFHKRAAATSYLVRAMSEKNLAVITVDQTGTMFLLGRKNGLAMEPSTSISGTAMGDASKYDIILKGKESTHAPTISTAQLADLIL